MVKIAVCVKEVPSATAPRRLDPAAHRLDRSADGELNPFDVHGLEEAIRLREGGADVEEIVVVCMGRPQAQRALARALALGADRVVLLTDEALAGSDIVATSLALSAVLEHEQPDLVLLGQQAADADCYVMAAAVAERLQRPLITQVAELSLTEGGLRGKRQAEHGYDVIEAPLPAVISVSDAINVPRLPSIKAIMGAKRKPFETLSAADAGIDAGSVGEAGSGTAVRAVSPPAQREAGRRIEDADGDAADQVVAFLVERGVM
jgi:electron transfer flavoprotein beta subunit